MVKAFVDPGTKTVIASRKLENCEALAGEVKASGGEALAVGCHVGSWADCDTLTQAVYDHFSWVGVLIDNIGMSLVYPRFRRLCSTKLLQWI